MKNLVLFGFMGTGKTLLSHLLAEKLDLKRIDMDDLIEQQEQTCISDIFAHKGEPYFRQCEKRVATELGEQQGLLISTGGGVVLNADNIHNLARNGVCVCLCAEPETIYERVRHEQHRPLLRTENPLQTIRDLLEKRKDCYAKVPFQVHTDGKTPEQLCSEIIQIYHNHIS